MLLYFIINIVLYNKAQDKYINKQINTFWYKPNLRI